MGEPLMRERASAPVAGAPGATSAPSASGSASDAKRSTSTTVAAVAIGNELLSGKVTDLNLTYAIKELRGLGTPVVLALIVPDERDAIVDAIRYACARADLVFTSGGIGPTHDDITIAAIAAAFGRGLYREPTIEKAIRSWYREFTNDDVLRMADLPVGSELIRDERFFLPLLKVDKVHVFPGEPTHFKRQFDIWKLSLRQEPFVLSQIFLDVDESEIARDLREVETAHGVAIGSYPKTDTSYRVLVTIESKDRAAVEAASRDLLSRLKPGRLVRTESN